ncbi:hypothetical protein, partial [Paenibacillus phytohabitans]
MNKRKKKVWIVPTIASVAAALLLFILAPSLMNNMNSSSSDSAEMAQENSKIAMDTEKKEAASKDESISALQEPEEPKQDDDVGIFSSEEKSIQGYAVNSIEDNQVLLTYGVLLGGASFPSIISVVIESNGENVVEQWQKNVPIVNNFFREHSDLGIDEIPESYFSDFEEIVTKDNSKAVRIDVSNSVNTESFATAETSHFSITVDSFRYLSEDYQHVELFQNNQQGIYVGQTGILEKNIDIEKDTKKAYLYYVSEESNYKLLAQTYN